MTCLLVSARWPAPAVFIGFGDARDAVNVLSSDVVVACGVESPGAASEVALALTARLPTVLLSACPTAATFFASLVPGVMVYVVATPEAVIAVIEQHLEISALACGLA